jgi:hypothetical protein
MKKLHLRLLVAGFLFLSCHKTNDQNPGITNTQITSGTWRITLFTDHGTDETTDFSGYSFSFGADGVLTTVKGSTPTAGIWSMGSKFNIGLGDKNDANKPLGELTDDWHIIATSGTSIQLGDDNASSGELLTFTKN